MVPVTRMGRRGKVGQDQQWKEKVEGLQGVQGKWKEAEGKLGGEGKVKGAQGAEKSRSPDLVLRTKAGEVWAASGCQLVPL